MASLPMVLLRVMSNGYYNETNTAGFPSTRG